MAKVGQMDGRQLWPCDSRKSVVTVQENGGSLCWINRLSG